MNLLLIVAAILVVVGLLWLVVAKLERGKIREGGEDEATRDDKTVPVPYVAVDRVLSAAEASFHSVLRQALPILTAEAGKDEPPLLLAKVRLSDLLKVMSAELAASAANEGGGRRWSESQAARNRIDRKHVDFVLCHPSTTRPLLVIELDDVSHQRAERRARDEFVDRACGAASVPILHVKAAAAYQPCVVAAEMARAMKIGAMEAAVV